MVFNGQNFSYNNEAKLGQFCLKNAHSIQYLLDKQMSTFAQEC